MGPDLSPVSYSNNFGENSGRDVLFEYLRAVVPFTFTAIRGICVEDHILLRPLKGLITCPILEVDDFKV